MLNKSLATIINLIWILGCASVFFYLLKSQRRLPGNLVVMVVVALFIRVIPALLMPNGANYEMSVFREAADIFRRGDSIYLVRVAHPYLPLQIYWYSLAVWLTENVGLFFVFWLKSLNIVADVLITSIIFIGLSRFASQEIAHKASWLYVFNPITILVAAYQGQFDAVPLFFIMLAWYFFEKSKNANKDFIGTAWSTGVAILSKTWPFILVPIVFLRLGAWRQRVQFMVVVSFPPLLGIILFELLFPGSWQAMLRRAMRAGAISGWWGYSSLLSGWLLLTNSGQGLFDWVSTYGKYIGYFAGFATVWLTRKRPLFVSLLLTILVMDTAVPNLGLQSLSWIVPIALIVGRYNALGWFVLGALVHMLISYWCLHLANWLYLLLPVTTANLIVQLSSLTVWLVMVLWWIEEWVENIEVLPKIFHKEPLFIPEPGNI